MALTSFFSNLTDMFHELLNAERFVDVTLACDNNTLKCHKVRITLTAAEVSSPSTILNNDYLLGRSISMFLVFPKTPRREPVQASNHHHATRNRIRRPSIYHRVRL